MDCNKGALKLKIVWKLIKILEYWCKSQLKAKLL